MIPEDIAVFVLGTLLLGLVIVVPVALAQYREPDYTQSSNRLERFIDTDDIAQNDIVLCRSSDVDRIIDDGWIRFHAPMMGQADSIRHIECDVDEPVFLDSEDISRFT